MSAEERSGQLIVKRMEDRSEGGCVAYITVNNPAKRNMLGMSGKRAIAAAFRELARDDTLRAAVLTGAGEKSFMAGGDIAKMKDLNAEQAEEEHTLTHRAFEAKRMCPLPVIGRINGYCFGLGMKA